MPTDTSSDTCGRVSVDVSVDQVAAKIGELADAGVSSFILSGYPHLEECDLFAKYVMPQVMSLR
jgi:alkanesulfonate monooxygenase SsuD/methylene tetrahydromethanopterin reductase-like flavin-dependent oxidoreductase (luciferase family)